MNTTAFVSFVLINGNWKAFQQYNIFEMKFCVYVIQVVHVDNN